MADGVVMVGGSVQGNYGDGCVFEGVYIRSTSQFGKGCTFKNCTFDCGEWWHPNVPSTWTTVGEGSVAEGGSCRCSNWGQAGTVWGNVTNSGANVPAQYVNSPPRIQHGTAVSETGGPGGLIVTPNGTAKDCAIVQTTCDKNHIPDGIAGTGWTQDRQGNSAGG